MSIELKIKSKHLAEEAKIIKFEEDKLLKRAKKAKDAAQKNQLLFDMRRIQRHRKNDVRRENRATFLARAYLNDKLYSSIEERRKLEKEHEFDHIVLPRVLSLIKKYGDWDKTSNVNIETLKEWTYIEKLG